MSISTEITRLQSAKANLKTAIEGKGVTVPADTLLDGYAQLVSSISGGGGGDGCQFKSGMFTGTGSSATETLNIGFEPDLLIVEGDLVYNEAGWRGTGIAIIIKGVCNFCFAHTSDTSTSFSTYSNYINSGQDPYGADSTSAYNVYGTYSNGEFTIRNTTNNANTYFVNGKTYTWKAYKERT